ncbi:sorting nexin-19 isoform X2 [Scyliorhinus torazame]|uniref:sorting nexin-19 isoform X2 n=1 Tax=Scyliorhinus torazame TaxID=75743 RepID=UPI003B5A6ADC
MPPGGAEDSGRLLNELLQRKWLGVSLLVLACLILQLLLNIWLLCVSVLLVLLGGWLGSQLVLSPTNLVHLERFIRLEPTLPPAESEQLLAKEIEGTITKIIRDFVTSWYRTVSQEPEFENEVQRAMHAMALELKRRMERVDRKGLAQKILILCSCHLEIYMKAKKTSREKIGRHRAEEIHSMWKMYCKVSDPHIALQSPATEVNYARGIVDLLLHVLVPHPNLETRTGRFVVRELIMCNVLLPLISKMADPDWINGIIIEIFTKSSNKEKVKEKPPQLEVPTSLVLKAQSEVITETTPTPKAEDVPSYDPADSLEPNMEDTDVSIDGSASKSNEKIGKSAEDVTSGYDHQRPHKLNLFYSCEEFEPESPQNDVKKDSTESLTQLATEELVVDRLTPVELTNTFDRPEDVSSDEQNMGESTILDTYTCLPSFDQNPASLGLEHVDDVGKEEAFAKLATSTTVLAHETIRILASQHTFQEKETIPSDNSTCNSLDVVSAGPVHTSSPTSVNVSAYSFEPLCSPDTPVVIHNLRISGTVTAKEHRGGGFHPYTLYTIKYETALDTENLGTLQQVAYHTVNRRYSEFLNLQTRLEEKAELRKLLKNVKGPKKLFPDLPFGNMDSDKVEARKSLLETFVKIVVSAIVDTLKTAFPRVEPQSPTEDLGECEVDGKSQGDGKKMTKSRLRFTSSKIAPALNASDIQAKVTYCYNENSLSEGLSIAGMEDFISEKEKLLKRMQINLKGKESKEVAAIEDDYTVKKLKGSEPPSFHWDLNSEGSETALADIALDLLCLLMKDHWTWLCTENMQKVIRLLCGTLIERWLEVQICNLTCTQHWVVYLKLLQEAIWPGGTLPKWPKPVRTQEQKAQTQELAFHCLMKMLPALVPEILGEEGYKKTWQLVLESLQDPMINRHLIYCIWDLLLEFLIPEASSEEFQKSLLACASGSSEKILI